MKNIIKFKYFSCYNNDKDDKLVKRESSPKRLGGFLSSSRSQNNIESNETPSKKNANKKESQFVNKLLETNESADESSATDDLTLERSRPNVGKIRDEYGEIELMIQYDTNRNKLLIKVNQAKDLINTDKDSLSDPYVRFVLQPDKKNKTKRKTKVIKDTLTPNWEELFEFDLHLPDAKTKTLDLMVKNEKSLFSREKTFMGQCLIALADIENIENGVTSWYKLEHQNAFDNIIKKIDE